MTPERSPLSTLVPASTCPLWASLGLNIGGTFVAALQSILWDLGTPPPGTCTMVSLDKNRWIPLVWIGFVSHPVNLRWCTPPPPGGKNTQNTFLFWPPKQPARCLQLGLFRHFFGGNPPQTAGSLHFSRAKAWARTTGA